MKINKITHIHRFNNLVAISFDGKPTVYLTKQHAWDLGFELKNCAADAHFREFSESIFKTKTIES